MKTRTYTLPTYWATYLFYGDESALEHGDITAIDAFIEHEKLGHVLSMSDDTDFVAWHDARDFCDYAADCADYTFEVLK